VRIVDATVINGPGNKAVQWRAHVQIDSVTGGFRAVELTDDSGGEKLSRHQFRPGEIVLGDRAYATARAVHAVRQAEAHVIVRFNPGNVRTCDMERRRIFLVENEGAVPIVGEVEHNILIPVPPKPTKSHRLWNSAKAIAWIPARAIAARARTRRGARWRSHLDSHYCGGISIARHRRHGPVPSALANRASLQKAEIAAPH
jgi:hypothetical protein